MHKMGEGWRMTGKEGREEIYFAAGRKRCRTVSRSYLALNCENNKASNWSTMHDECVAARRDIGLYSILSLRSSNCIALRDWGISHMYTPSFRTHVHGYGPSEGKYIFVSDPFNFHSLKNCPKMYGAAIWNWYTLNSKKNSVADTLTERSTAWTNVFSLFAGKNTHAKTEQKKSILKASIRTRLHELIKCPFSSSIFEHEWSLSLNFSAETGPF